ncbi:uncharacterized protein LOC129939144 [Eupeodes corollae]|uniref:uncharacterized protein LOC129939144 n=1 Tax=Eupeodes corollae TaxID=290404 RepID=UPI00249310BF|nr:uncharacterized protein LOC129939144 [Eupeodes corollae]
MIAAAKRVVLVLVIDLSVQLSELKQDHEVSQKIIQQILYSKRLLADHVESLEHCLLFLQQQDTSVAEQKPLEIFTARNTCVLLGSTILEHFITPKSLKLTLIPSVIFSASFSALYAIKNVFIFRNKVVERELDSLIRSIDEFGNCIRRNMTYFNEVLVMKASELIESRQIERAWDCITSIKEVVEVLFDATRKLEMLHPIPSRFTEYYSPMEDLKECDYFRNNITDYSPKNIKDFYNIFAYVQSQYLFRLALTVSQKPSLSSLSRDLSSVEFQIHQLVKEEENHFKNLSIDLRKKKQLEANEFNQNKTMRCKSGPVAVLQSSSLKLSSCMVAVAEECQQLDEALQRLTETEAVQKDESKDLIDVANSMRSIEGTLSVCFDDFHRLMLVYNKFLSSKLDDRLLGDKKTSSANDADGSESILRVEISHENSANDDGGGVKSDDFYAYMFEENEQQEDENEFDNENHSQCADREILNFEKRVTKGKFKPVLRQLKNRIDPIRQEMLEKERRVLEAKGINVDELFASDETNRLEEVTDESAASGSGDESDEGSADEVEKRSKKFKDRDNFAEMRNFLAQKQAINLFQLDLPQNNATPSNEDIIE